MEESLKKFDEIYHKEFCFQQPGLDTIMLQYGCQNQDFVGNSTMLELAIQFIRSNSININEPLVQDQYKQFSQYSDGIIDKNCSRKQITQEIFLRKAHSENFVNDPLIVSPLITLDRRHPDISLIEQVKAKLENSGVEIPEKVIDEYKEKLLSQEKKKQEMLKGNNKFYENFYKPGDRYFEVLSYLFFYYNVVIEKVKKEQNKDLYLTVLNNYSYLFPFGDQNNYKKEIQELLQNYSKEDQQKFLDVFKLNDKDTNKDILQKLSGDTEDVKDINLDIDL